MMDMMVISSQRHTGESLLLPLQRWHPSRPGRFFDFPHRGLFFNVLIFLCFFIQFSPNAYGEVPPTEVLWLPRSDEPAVEIGELYRLLPQAASLLQDPRAFTLHPVSSSTVLSALREADPRFRGRECPDDDDWIWQKFIPSRVAPLVERADGIPDLTRALALFEDLLLHAPCTWAPITNADARSAWLLAGTAAFRAGLDETTYLDAAYAAQPDWAGWDALPDELEAAWVAAGARHFSLPPLQVPLQGMSAVDGREVLLNGTPLPTPLPDALALTPGRHLLQVLDGASAMTAVISIPSDMHPSPLNLLTLLPELERNPEAEMAEAFRTGKFPQWMEDALRKVERLRNRQYTFLATLVSIDEPDAPVPGLRIWYLDSRDGVKALPKELWGTAFRPGLGSPLRASLDRTSFRGKGVGGSFALGYGSGGSRHWLVGGGGALFRIWRPFCLDLSGTLASNLGFQANGGGDAGGTQGLFTISFRVSATFRIPAGPVRPYLGLGGVAWVRGAGELSLRPSLQVGLDFRRVDARMGPYTEGRWDLPLPGGEVDVPFAILTGLRWDP